MAENNGIKNYIVIDCRKSEFEWIVTNTQNALAYLLNLDGITWEKIWIDCQRSKLIQACEAWKEKTEEETTKSLAKKLKVDKSSICRWLNIGTKYGLCNYNPEMEKKNNYKRPSKEAKKVVQYSIDGTFIKIWDSSSIAEKRLGICKGGIWACCNGKNKTAKGFVWKFLYD